jgi:molecular chaperone HscB
VFENHGVKLLVDPKSLAYIDGTELDFVREGLNEGFGSTTPTSAIAAAAERVFRVGATVNLQSSDFELFGLPQRFAQDAPDRRALEGTAARSAPRPLRRAGRRRAAAALQWSVRINEAYQRLKDPLKRAAYLCELLGAPIDAHNNTAMPPAFLMEQMEWREALDEADGEEALEALSDRVLARRKESWRTSSGCWTWTPTLPPRRSR